MRATGALACALAALRGARAWGGFGHVTIAYVASNFVSGETASYFQDLLGSDGDDYLASVATWADSIRYTRWGRFTSNFHFIDAKDSPPGYCGVDLDRDCKASGCVVSAIQNYTDRLMDPSLPKWERAQAAKFVIHLVGDIHQPLHAEDVSRGGNGIHVRFDGAELNLHHVWDSSIPEKMVGGVGRKPYAEALRWADELSDEIQAGRFRAQSEGWLDEVDLSDAIGTALAWARQGNAYVCSHVLPEGPKEIAGQELGADYYEKAAPVIEVQVARAGYRLAAWLDKIAASINKQEIDEL